MGNNGGDLKTEIILRLALAEQVEQDPDILAFLPEDEQDEKHVFSPEHEKKMKKISRMARRLEHRPERRRLLLRAAACIVVFVGISTVTISSVDAFRIPILSFFADVKEKATQYQVTKRMDYPLTKSFAEFEPTYMPEGFYVETFEETKDRFSILYTNDSTGLWYEIHYSEKPFTLSFDTEEAKVQELTVNKKKTIIVSENGQFRAIMYLPSAQIVLSGTISWDEAKKVLESIK